MISAAHFFSGTLNTVDAVIGGFVNAAYVNFVEANTGIITALFTLYVILIGYQFVTHTNSFHLGSLMRHVVVMLAIYGLVMNWQLYHLFIYNIFTNEPSHIADVLVNAAKGTDSIADILDNIYLTILNTTVEFFSQVNFGSGLAFIFYGALVYVIGLTMCVFALLLFIYAKMMMAIALALGPIFLLFMLWNTTKPLFSAWLNKLITIALIPIVTSAILMLMLSVIKVTLKDMNLPVEQLQFHGISPFLGLSLATALILSQVLKICAFLAGGLSLSNISAGAQMAGTLLNKSGVSTLAKTTKTWVINKSKISRG